MRRKEWRFDGSQNGQLGSAVSRFAGIPTPSVIFDDTSLKEGGLG